MARFSEDAERRIAQRIATGAFTSADAVVDEALSALDWFEERKAFERAWLEDKLARAVGEADRGEFVDGPAFFAELEAHILSRSEPVAQAAE